jgi:hypothetical protein
MTGTTVIATSTAGPGRPGHFLRSLAPTRSASLRTRSTPPPLDGPGCNPMTTRASARTRIITLIAAAALLALGGCASDPATAPTTSPATAADVAAAFAAAYATGDVPTACSYASGDAVEKLNKNGWCQQKQQWNVQYWQTGTCTLPTGETSFIYGTSSEIDRIRGFEVLVAGTNDVYKVTRFAKGGSSSSSPSYCAIYATKSSAG